MNVLPVGTDALLVEVSTGEEAQALHAELLRRRADGTLTVREIVPAARTVLLDGLTDPAGLAAELARARPSPVAPPARRTVEVPVRYDGPDLAEVAAHWGVSPREAARIHAGCTFRVAFCGFAPGFGYLTGLPARYDTPRRATPRTAVPAGSVALAGPYTGVYPRTSPGGWQLIGTTDLPLWDPEREPAALLTPGTRVRFVPVDAEAPAPERPDGDGETRDPADAPNEPDAPEAPGATDTARTARTADTPRTAATAGTTATAGNAAPAGAA